MRQAAAAKQRAAEEAVEKQRKLAEVLERQEEVHNAPPPPPPMEIGLSRNLPGSSVLAEPYLLIPPSPPKCHRTS